MVVFKQPYFYFILFYFWILTSQLGTRQIVTDAAGCGHKLLNICEPEICQWVLYTGILEKVFPYIYNGRRRLALYIRYCYVWSISKCSTANVRLNPCLQRGFCSSLAACLLGGDKSITGVVFCSGSSNLCFEIQISSVQSPLLMSHLMCYVMPETWIKKSPNAMICTCNIMPLVDGTYKICAIAMPFENILIPSRSWKNSRDLL